MTTTPPLYGKITPDSDSGKCLDAIASSNGSIPDGTAVHLLPCATGLDYGTTNSSWKILPDGTIRNDFGSCLDNLEAGTADGNQVALWTCNDAADQKWEVDQDSIVNLATGKCLDSTSPTNRNGTSLPSGTVGMSLYTCSGAATQQWSTPLPGGPVTLASNPAVCLDQNSTTTQAASCLADSPYQLWTMQYYYNAPLQTTGGGRRGTFCLTGSSNVTGQTCDLEPHQFWVYGGNGMLVNADTLQCLTLTSGNATMTPCAGTDSQDLAFSQYHGRIQQQGHQSLCLDQSRGLHTGGAAGTTLVLSCGPSAQEWTYTSNNTITQTVAQGTGCLTASQGSTDDGTPVTLDPCTPDADGQRWRSMNDGSLRNTTADKCLTFGWGASTTTAVLAACTGAANQLVKFTRG